MSHSFTMMFLSQFLYERVEFESLISNNIITKRSYNLKEKHKLPQINFLYQPFFLTRQAVIKYDTIIFYLEKEDKVWLPIQLDDPQLVNFICSFWMDR